MPHRDWLDKLGITLSALTFVAAVVAAVAAIAAAMYTGHQVIVARDTLDEVRETSRKELRAYVFVKPFGRVNGIPNAPQTLIWVRNAGQTPARDLVVRYDIDVRNSPPQSRDYPGKRTAGFERVLDSATQTQSEIFNLLRPITNKEFTGIRVGKNKRIFVWGVATYKDVFGERHDFPFCHFYFGARDPKTSSISRLGFCDPS